MATSLSRPREYLALLAGALVVGLCGALFDQITATISPEYFLEGKRLALSRLPFRLAVAWTGFRGGLPLGALVAGIGLIHAERDPTFSWRLWLRKMATMLAATLPLGAVLMAAFDPLQVRHQSFGGAGGYVATRYLICWGLHIGAYVGIVAALFMRGGQRAPLTIS